MANHAHLYTRKKMSQDSIKEILETLNRDMFYGLLNIEVGDNYFIVTLHGLEKFDEQRLFWLNTSRHFETRHSCSLDFMWWVYLTVFSTIIQRYGGRWEDDGTWEEIPDIIPTFREYLKRKSRGSWFKYLLFRRVCNNHIPKVFFKK